MDWISLFVTVAGAIFLLLGIAHNALTLTDLKRPSKIVPDNPQVIAAMRTSTVRLTRGQATVWDAWLGFNLSHGIGLIIFGLIAVTTAYRQGGMASPWILGGFVVLSAVYLLLSIRFFFRSPVLGTGLATALFFGAWLATLFVA